MLGLQTLFKAIQEFRKVGDLTASVISIYLYICRNEGCSQKEIARSLGISQASASRNIMLLSEWHRLNRPGLNWVRAEPNPAERRSKMLFLTPKGRLVRDSLIEIMETR